MTSEKDPYPPLDSIDRAVLVSNISPAASPAAVEDFFSFCGAVESHKMRTVLAAAGNQHVQEAVVVFVEARARADALVMDKSSIVDQPVSISPIPDAYDFNTPLEIPPKEQNFFESGFYSFGDLFSGVGAAVAAEVDKAGKILNSATDTGVLKSAKDQVALASERTKSFATELDDKWRVRDNLSNAATTSRDRASQVASAVASQTINAAQQVDKSLHISENTGKLAERARENQTVNSGIMAFTGGFQQLLTQTGLRQAESETQAPETAPSDPDSRTTSSTPQQQQ